MLSQKRPQKIAELAEGSVRDYHRAIETGQGGREDKVGGRDDQWDGISGAVLGLRPVSVADGYLWIPLCCGIYT